MFDLEFGTVQSFVYLRMFQTNRFLVTPIFDLEP
jgi:hypothetical protein